MNIITSRPKKPKAPKTSSATIDVTGSSIWRNGLFIFLLLCSVGHKSRSGLVTGCTRDSLDRFWAGEVEGLEFHRWLTGARQCPACEFSKRPPLRLSGRWAEGFSRVVLDGQSLKSERFFAAY